MRVRGGNGHSVIPVAALTAGLAILLVGCVTPPVATDPSASPLPSLQTPTPTPEPSVDPSGSEPPAPSEYPSDAPGQGGPNPDQPIDPDHPWPASVPRPPGMIVSESSAPSPIGEGSVWNIVFEVGSLAQVESYVASLHSAGWSYLDDRDYPIRGSDGSVAWAMGNNSMLGELSVANANTNPVRAEFAILGF